MLKPCSNVVYSNYISVISTILSTPENLTFKNYYLLYNAPDSECITSYMLLTVTNLAIAKLIRFDN